MMVVRNIDALFDLPHMSAVVAGQGCHPDWIDLNSGLMVIEPEEGETDRMLDLLGGLREEELAEYAGIGDQDVVQLAIRTGRAKGDSISPRRTTFSPTAWQDT